MRVLVWFLYFLVAILFFSTHAQSANIERLFSTPETRNYLDKLRQQHEIPLEFEEDTVAPVKLKSEPVVYNGFVIKHDKNIKSKDIWVNGKAAKNNKGVGATSGRTQSITVTIPDSRRVVRLKPGQKYDNVTDKVIEAYKKLTPPSVLLNDEKIRQQ